MISAQALSNSILKRSFQDNVDVTPMKLQKLIYFVYREHLQRCGQPLFGERFETWQYGPVLPSVYEEFRSYQAGRIAKFATDAQDNVYVVNEDTAPDIKKSIDKVWAEYKDLSAIELSRLTHKEGTAWSTAFHQRAPYLSDEDIRAEGTAHGTKC